jgi:hypothetical protein
LIRLGYTSNITLGIFPSPDDCLPRLNEIHMDEKPLHS